MNEQEYLEKYNEKRKTEEKADDHGRANMEIEE